MSSRVARVAVIVGLVAGCGGTGGPGATPASGRIAVVAAENCWGSIATQLGGDHVSVTSIVTNPNTDPHAYEPTPADARTLASAGYVIVNGAGYDAWVPHLLDANPVSGRRVLTVADLAGRKVGDNPHMWYDPTVVMHAVDAITRDYKALDPADSVYFEQEHTSFVTAALKNYNHLRTAIKSRFSGVAVGATESIFIDLASDLNLDLVTPRDYMKAISEGNDPTAADKAAFDAQVMSKQFAVLVYNRQNSTPDVQALIDTAHAKGIPVVAMTETLDPATATFQDWQSDQLQTLETALARAPGS